VRERGVFSGIFGIMVSSGYALALTLGGIVLTRLGLPYVFLVPALAIAVMFLIDFFVVKDTPEKAGFKDFETGDASQGDDAPVDLAYLAKKLLGNPIVVRLAAAEFCTGFVRQGLLLYFLEYLLEVHHVDVKAGGGWTSVAFWASAAPTIGGIVGGLLCGWLSDRFFDSRRPPVAFLFYLGQIVTLLLLGVASSAPIAAFLIGLSCTWIFGVHGMLSGTASMDFGGRKAAASAAGLLDGVQYLASGLTGFGLGWIIQHHGWRWWTWSIIPFSVIGAGIMLTLWNEKPRRTIAPASLPSELDPQVDGAA
jgi:OPA family glycerol-3-phosphate transporter-like MFS transporter